MLAQLVIKLKRAESSRAELATSRASSRDTSILPSPTGILSLLSDYSAFLSHGAGRHSSCLQSSTKREATAEREATMKETIKLFHLMVVF
jgi:hypothetical protein